MTLSTKSINSLRSIMSENSLGNGVGGSLNNYCSLKPLWSGMGEVVPAHTSPTLHPHPLPLCCNYPV